MWCPEGYVSLNEITFWFSWDSDQISSARDRPVRDGENLAIDTGIDAVEFQAFNNWLCLAFLRRFRRDLRVCTASGSVLRVTDPLSNLSLDRGWVSFADYAGGFPEDYETRLRISKWEFEIVDIRFGRIRDDRTEALKHLSPIFGLPICLKKEALPVPPSKLTNYFLKNGFPVSWEIEDELRSVDNVTSPRSKGGRPKLHKEIVQTFLSTFPMGLQGRPMTEVSARLGYDRKTVKLALRDAGLYQPRVGQKPGENPQAE